MMALRSPASGGPENKGFFSHHEVYRTFSATRPTTIPSQLAIQRNYSETCPESRFS
jgi:hypothetical protein